MSRILRVILWGALAVTILGGPAQAQQPPFATTKVEGTDNVYIFRYGNAQAMFVVTSAGVIATDPIGYGRPQAVTTYVDEIKKVTNQPVRYVIYSHHHYDHIAGGKAVQGRRRHFHRAQESQRAPRSAQGSAHGAS
jgi:glyoxylase-like metal-dependent hydrolase (beta-lactamase superfamily II)